MPQSAAAQPDSLHRAAPSSPPKDLLQEGRKLQQLIQQVEQLRDPVARATVHECLQSLLAFYGDGLARLLRVVQASGTAGEHVYAQIVEDPTVRGLLLIHGLHPLDLRTRLNQAMEKVRPYMESHGGNVQLISLENDVARFRLQGACQTCPSSSITLELALRQAIEQACPDLMGFEVDNAPTHSVS
ncbi:MAG TPA: NifU family protein [Verrucomicrobiae bacterium]|nr:NifU family protein [Verrucomicrobiae bacterium]